MRAFTPLLLTAVAGLTLPATAAADTASADAALAGTVAAGIGTIVAPPPLMLVVLVNGEEKPDLGTFTLDAAGRVVATRTDLQALGFSSHVVGVGPYGVALDDLPGVAYRYDEAQQTIAIDAPASMLRETRVSPNDDDMPELSPSGLGAVINYTVLATSDDDLGDAPTFAAQIEGRVYGPFGLVTTSVVSAAPPGEAMQLIRLDTSWIWEDPSDMVTMRAGDAISSGTSWSRPIRFGGLQFGRSFSLRPAMVTMPLPEVRGSAATPSSIDLYVDGIRQMTTSVPAGPFSLQYAPGVIGAGASQVVVRDVLGRETVTDLSFYTAGELLARGLLDFSVEAGFARRNFGYLSNDYDRHLVGSATLRYGLADQLTLQTHVEGAAALINLGVGGVTTLGGLALVSASGVFSRSGAGSGAIVDVSAISRRGPFSLSLRATRTYGTYDDLASVTARGNAAFGVSFARPPRATEQAQLSTRLWTRWISASISYVRIQRDSGETRIVSSALSQRLGRATVYVRGSTNFETPRSNSAAVGVSVPFGRRSFGSSEIVASGGKVAVANEVVGNPVAVPGDIGWRARSTEGAVTDRLAAVSYMSDHGRFEGGLQQSGGRIRGFAQAEGSLVLAAGDLFASRRINGAFGVVDAGMPGIAVTEENRLAGRTNSRGRLLLPNLVAYQANKVGIDTSGLPVDREIDDDRFVLTPRTGFGAVLRLRPRDMSHNALATFVDVHGQPIVPGSVGRVEDGGDPFVVGYDGAAYLTDLKASNHVDIERPSGEHCVATFRYAPVAGEQVRLGPITCQSLIVAAR